MNSSKTALGLLAGIATGAILGILFAPDKGSETRRKIVEKGEGYADDVKQKFNDLKGNIKDKYQSIKHEAENMQEEGKEKYAEVKAQFKNTMS